MNGLERHMHLRSLVYRFMYDAQGGAPDADEVSAATEYIVMHREVFRRGLFAAKLSYYRYIGEANKGLNT